MTKTNEFSAVDTFFWLFIDRVFGFSFKVALLILLLIAPNEKKDLSLTRHKGLLNLSVLRFHSLLPGQKKDHFQF